MSYEPTTWKAGDTVTSAKLNKMEQGIAAGGGALVVNVVHEQGKPNSLGKTAKEIFEAFTSGINVVLVDEGDSGVTSGTLTGASLSGGGKLPVSYLFTFKTTEYAIMCICDSSDGNPTVVMYKFDTLHVEFEMENDKIEGDVRAEQIYSAFMNGTSVIFTVPIDEDVYFDALLTTAAELSNGSYFFQTDSDATEFAHFTYEATTGHDFPVLTSGSSSPVDPDDEMAK